MARRQNPKIERTLKRTSSLRLCYRLFINHPKIRHKVSANRTKYQISSLIFNFSGAQASKLGVLGISEAQPNFNKS